MPYSYIRLPGNGSNTNFNFSFGYLSRTHVHATVDNVETPFTWLSDFSIQITPAPANGTIVEIRRITPVDQQPVLWTDGSTITEKDMNLEARFNLYVNQEARDAVAEVIGQDSTGIWDGQGRKTTNFDDPTDMTGLVTRNYFENHYTPLLDSKVAAAEAQVVLAQGKVVEATAQANSAASSASQAGGFASDAEGFKDGAEDLLDSFMGVYQGPSATPPSTRPDGSPLQAGDLYYHTGTPRELRLWTGTFWQNAGSTIQGVVNVPDVPVVATEGQTEFPVPGGFNANYILVFVNGVKVDAPEIDTSDGLKIVFSSPLSAGDEVTWVAFGVFEAANAIPANGSVTTNKYADNSLTDIKVSSLSKLYNRIHDFVSVKDYGAKGDNSTNDTAAIQAALDANPGKLIYFPAGVYRISAELVVRNGSHLMGAGEGATFIRCTSATANMFRVGSQSNSLADVMIEGFHLDTTIQKTAGAAIIVENSHNIRLRNLRFAYDHHISVHFVGGPEQYLYYLTDFEINSGTHGILIDGYAQDVWIARGIVAEVASAGIWLKHCSGVYVNGVSILQCYNGVQMIPYAGETVRLCFFHEVIADTCSGNGWELDTSQGGHIIGMNISSCWGSSTQNINGAGFKTSGGGGSPGLIRGIALTTFRCMNNNGHGMILQRGEGITLSNCHVTSNSRGNLGNYSGIFIGSGLSQWQISSGLSGSWAETFANSGQRYGLHINAGCTDYSVTGLNVSGNVSRGIQDESMQGSIYGCVGFRTHNNGERTVPAGATNVTINHNMGWTPHVRDIQVWPLVNPHWIETEDWWVSDVGPVSFQLNFQDPVTVETYFGWRCTYPLS